jgi:3-hydroxyisobutyrate dehydrogenase-like beta-hydroxyacid dehydrogenase
MRIGFIGLGQMGAAMAASLLKAGHEVTVYNRSAGRIAPLVALGARAALDVPGACTGEAVFTMVADDPAIEALAFGEQGIAAHLPADAIHVSCSTISVAMARRLATRHAQAGQHFICAPVFGRPEAAAAATLFVVAAGAPAALQRCAPLFEAIGQRTFVISEQPADANLVKLSGNLLIAIVIESLGEVLALTGKAGIDAHQYLELLTSTLFTAPVYKTYGSLIVAGQTKPAGFTAPLGLKDITLALQAAQELHVPLPLGSVLRDRFLRLVAAGDEQLDWSAIAQLAAQDAGLTPR